MIPSMLPWFFSFQSLSCVHHRSSTRILQHNHTSVVRLARTTIFLFPPPSETWRWETSFPPTAPAKLVPDASHFRLWNVSAAATNSAMRSSQSCVIVVVNSGRTGNNLKQLFWRKKKTLRSYVWIVNKIIMGNCEFMQPCEGLLICSEFLAARRYYFCM